MFKLFGGSRKTAKAKSRKAAAQKPRTPPGEGIRQLAAALPQGDDTPPARPAPAQQAKPQPAQPPKPTAEPPVPAAEPVDRAKLIRDAMRIRRDKARDLENLSARDRRKLQHLAEKMMGVAADKPAAPDAGPPPGKKDGPSGTRH